MGRRLTIDQAAWGAAPLARTRQLRASTTWLGCSVPSLRQNGPVIIEEPEVVAALRRARARFALVHGSRAASGGGRAESDLDVAAWWGIDPPQPWDVELPTGVDLVVLDQAPLWLAGRIAVDGRLLYTTTTPRLGFDGRPTRVVSGWMKSHTYCNGSESGARRWSLVVDEERVTSTAKSTI